MSAPYISLRSKQQFDCVRNYLLRQRLHLTQAIVEYVSSSAEVLVIILGLGTEVRKANLATHQQFFIKVIFSHQDYQRAPHFAIPQFLFDRDTANGGPSSLGLDEWPPPPFETIEVLGKGGIYRAYMSKSNGDFG
jgi:hypothetical protein